LKAAIALKALSTYLENGEEIIEIFKPLYTGIW
jgi:hypothetical protein